METHTPLLTHAEERALARAIEAGVLAAAVRDHRGPHPVPAHDRELAALECEGDRAWHRLATANTKLVWLVVVPVSRRTGVDADELFQEGYLGLLESMQRYDHTRDARFATFALPWIRMRVMNAAATNLGSIGLSAGRARIWRRILAVEARLTAQLGRRPDDAEVGEESGDDPGAVRRWRAYTPPEPLPEQAEIAQPDRGPALPIAQLGRLVRGLPADHRAVILRRFGLGGHAAMTLAEVAAVLGVSESTVRRRELAALDMMRGRVGLLVAA